jgi:hypothetical protein
VLFFWNEWLVLKYPLTTIQGNGFRLDSYEWKGCMMNTPDFFDGNGRTGWEAAHVF